MRVRKWVLAALLIVGCGSSEEGKPAASGGGAGSAGGSGIGGTAGAGGSSGAAGASGGEAGVDAGGSGGTTAGSGGADAGADGSAGSAGGDAAADAGTLTAKECFAKQFVNASSTSLGPDYDQFNPTIGSHCNGTNHQSISGIQRVVFLGDSVTVGTPPTNINPAAVYRAILAKSLAGKLGLKPPGLGWGAADPFSGTAFPKESGDFVSCSKWGARTDDLMKDNNQITDCIPPNKRHLKHLVIMTMGGNDIAAITKDGGGTSPKKTVAELWQVTKDFVQNLRDAVVWLKSPTNVPGGADVVFANMYEFTDGTGETNSCVTAGLGGIEPWQDVGALSDMVIWANEQYMKIAVDTQSDMVFMLEAFCGHGYKRDDPTGPCYRGPNQPLWFDVTCIHPNAAGHVALASLFDTTIAE
ncbi:MAG: SGNH/GDSL hydrolase family protein [Polyangiaceae bacterium]